MSSLTKAVAALLFAFSILTHSASEKVIPLYNGTPLGSESWTNTEQSKTNAMGVVDSVWNIVKPTLTFFAPAPNRTNGTAVIICPGGAFMNLAIEHEGYALARFLAERGIASFVLKYRTVQRGESDSALKNFGQVGNVAKLAIEDGRAAIKHLKTHANDYAIDPEKIGILGFSAGGLLTVRLAHDYTAETRPAFAAPIYGAADLEKDGNKVPTNAPPLFLIAATDDFMFAGPSASLYQSWIKAKRPVEIHIYSKGGHGFGMKKQNLPSDTWCDSFVDWLDVHGLLGNH